MLSRMRFLRALTNNSVSDIAASLVSCGSTAAAKLRPILCVGAGGSKRRIEPGW
jgi:hypothetical protein